jgi:signal transduction histidine kinase
MGSNFNSLNNQNSDNKNLFPGDSQMAALMRTYNWESHPLGNPDNWPLSLKTGLRIVLHSAHPMFIWWAEELYMFHNDAYLPALGDKHPEALGAGASQMWSEIWPQLGGIVEEVLNGGEAFYAEELLIPLKRKGFMEDTYWTFSYSSMFDDDGKVNGIFCACNEVTETVLAKRRLQTIKDIAEVLVGLPSLEQVCRTACEVLADNSNDIPFSLIYLLEGTGKEARLVGQTADLPQEVAPPVVMLAQPDGLARWPFAAVQRSRQAEIVDLPGSKHLPKGPHSPLSNQAVILPIFLPGSVGPVLAGSGKDQLLGFFISGINPGLEYNADYQGFHQLLTGHIASSIAGIKSLAAVEHQKARLERFFMQAPASICILDGPDLVYELVNPGYQQLFPDRELLGKPILEALPEIADNAVYRTFREVYETGNTHEEQALHIPLARPEDGKLEDRYFKYIQQARDDGHGNIDGVLVFAYEVTDLVLARRKAEASERMLRVTSDELAAINEEFAAANEEIQASNEELNESNQQLIRINSDLDNFIYTASHDLKAPISNIEGLLQALLRSLPPEALAAGRTGQITDMMQSSIDRFRKTIANLTEITKLQKENSQDVTLISINEVIEEVIMDLEPMIESTNARLETAIEACTPIRFSPKNLRSIIYNLLSNALKYHSPERTPLVQVSCKETEGYLVLSVRDNGLGMNLSDDSKIFIMFKRLHDHVEGTGIGLYMVKKIIDNAGGKIEVESKVGEGSTFKVYFKP